MKKVFSCIFAMVMSLTSIISVSAASIEPNDITNQQLESKILVLDGKEVKVPKNANYITNIDNIYSINDDYEFDLTLLEPQTQIIELPNGELGSLTISPEIPKNSNSRASYDLASGTSYWNIYWYGGVVNLGYKITVSNPVSGATTITDYSNSWYTTVGASVSSSSFTRNSSKTIVEYKLNVNQTQWVSFTNTLTASVSGNVLKTTFSG